MTTQKTLSQHSNLHLGIPTSAKSPTSTAATSVLGKRKPSTLDENPGGNKYLRNITNNIKTNDINVTSNDDQTNDNTDWVSFFDGNTKHASYLYHRLKNQGKQYIVGMQMSEADPTRVTDLDADVHMACAALLLRLSTGDRELLSNFMTLSVKKVLRDVKEINTGYARAPVPTSMNDFRRYLEGKGAILNNIPIPTVYSLEGSIGDAYCLPSDFI